MEIVPVGWGCDSVTLLCNLSNFVQRRDGLYRTSVTM